MKDAIWDNNYPYPNIEKDFGPYLEWYIADSSNHHDSFINEENGKFFSYINEKDGNGWHKRKYQLTEMPFFLPSGCGNSHYDTQNIYNLWSEDCTTYTSDSRISETSTIMVEKENNTIDYLFPNHIKITIVGGEIDYVTNTVTGETVALKPYGEINPDQAVIMQSSDSAISIIYLPAEKTYQIEATKDTGFPLLKVFATIPNTDGTVEKLNYENLETGKDDETHISFIVGRDNTDKGIIRSVPESDSHMLDAQEPDVYYPDYDAVLTTDIPSPESFSAVYENSALQLHWQNVSHPHLAEVLIIRKEGEFPQSSDDGTVVYQGLDEETTDSGVESDKLFFYAAYSVDSNSLMSEPVYAGINTGRHIVLQINNFPVSKKNDVLS